MSEPATPVLYRNGQIFLNDAGFVPGGFLVEDGRFEVVFSGETPADIPSDAEVIDLAGAHVIPGLVDIHIHGAMDADFSDGSLEGLTRMAGWLASRGVTSFVPTSMTISTDHLKTALSGARSFMEHPEENSAKLLGVHLEGPFLSPKKKGSQNAAFLRSPDAETFIRIYEESGQIIRLLDLAPELPGAMDLIRRAAALCRVSLAHTEADYDTACEAFDAGASHVTHLFNAMPPLLHRAPGIIGAAAEREHVTAELICDGLHVHPSIVRAAFRLFPGRICLISDSLRCAGMPDGTYELAGQQVTLTADGARLSDGTLAGSFVDLYTCMERAVSFGIPVADAIRAATSLPAAVVGCADQVGSIAPGRQADFVLCDEKLRRSEMYVRGNRVQ